MYKCKNCGYIFEEPTCHEDFESIDVGCGRLIVADLSYEECPHCKGEFDDVYECECCGEYDFLDNLEEYNGEWLCNRCVQELKNVNK